MKNAKSAGPKSAGLRPFSSIVLDGAALPLPVGERVTLWAGPNMLFVGKAVDETGKEWNWPDKAKKHMPKQQEYAGLTASANRRVVARRIVARFKGR